MKPVMSERTHVGAGGGEMTYACSEDRKRRDSMERSGRGWLVP
jgi:hypothetical protein